MDYRLYTALFYLNKGVTKAFWDLLCIEPNENIDLKSSEDLYWLEKNDYIIFKSSDNIILTSKSLDLLKSKNVKDEENIIVDNEFIEKFQEGFPAKRFDKKPAIKAELELFVAKHSYSKDEILNAKQIYINEQIANNFTYTKLVSNFIKTDLENYCRFQKVSQKENNDNIFID